MDGQSLKLYSIRGERRPVLARHHLCICVRTCCVCPFAANSWAVLLLLAESPLQQARRQAPLLK